MPKILNNTSLYILLSDKFTHENAGVDEWCEIEKDSNLQLKILYKLKLL